MCVKCVIKQWLTVIQQVFINTISKVIIIIIIIDILNKIYRLINIIKNKN